MTEATEGQEDQVMDETPAEAEPEGDAAPEESGDANESLFNAMFGGGEKTEEKEAPEEAPASAKATAGKPATEDEPVDVEKEWKDGHTFTIGRKQLTVGKDIDKAAANEIRRGWRDRARAQKEEARAKKLEEDLAAERAAKKAEKPKAQAKQEEGEEEAEETDDDEMAAEAEAAAETFGIPVVAKMAKRLKSLEARLKDKETTPKEQSAKPVDTRSDEQRQAEGLKALEAWLEDDENEDLREAGIDAPSLLEAFREEQVKMLKAGLSRDAVESPENAQAALFKGARVLLKRYREHGNKSANARESASSRVRSNNATAQRRGGGGQFIVADANEMAFSEFSRRK